MQRPPHSFDANSTDSMDAQNPLSNHLQVPNVVVTPPEEEHEETPPFVVFDASKAALDLDSVDEALDVHQQIQSFSPLFTRSINGQNSSGGPRKRNIIPFVPPSDWEGNISVEQDTDDDVVEVIKVRKRDVLSEVAAEVEAQKRKRSNNFKSRATKVLRSIRKVGKGQPKAPVEELQPSEKRGGSDPKPKQSDDQVPSTRRSTRKRKTKPLGQIFHFGRDDSEPSKIQDPLQPSPTSFEPPAQPIPPTSVHDSPTRASISLAPEVPESDKDVTTARSSEPLIKRSPSFRKRLSQLDLPRIFSTSSTSSSNSIPSEASSPSPPTPTQEIIPQPGIAITQSPPLSPTEGNASGNWILTNLDNPDALEDDDDDEIDYGELHPLSMVLEEESSREMRLDSMHFVDGISFDANDFTMTTLKGGGHRRRVPVAIAL